MERQTSQQPCHIKGQACRLPWGIFFPQQLSSLVVSNCKVSLLVQAEILDIHQWGPPTKPWRMLRAREAGEKTRGCLLIALEGQIMT